MATLSTSARPQPAKRFACDRCREHKLRCPREDQTGPSCARCVRAGTACVTSNLRPLGRPARKITPRVGTERKRRQSEIESGQSSLDCDLDMLYGLNAAGNPLSPFSPAENDPPESGAEPAATAPEDSRGSALDTPGPGLFRLDPVFLSGLTEMPDDFLGSESSNGQNQFWISSLNDTIFQSPGDGENTPTQPYHISNPHSQNAVNGPSQNPDSNSSAVPDRSDAAQKATSSTDSIQRLSVLAASLSEQLGRIRSTPWSVTLVSIVCANQENETANNPLGEVLQSTSGFMHILQAIALRTSPMDQAGPGTKSPNPDPVTQSSSTSDTFSSHASAQLNSLVQPFRINSSSISQIHTPESATTQSSNETKLDIATALVILACYTQIIQIYNVLFSGVHESLCQMSHQTISSSQALPGLQLGGFPVQYGNLQIKIFIQVIMHFLAHIERLLGTSAEFRLDPARGTTDGLFSTLELTALLRMVMSQNDGDDSTGEGVGYIVSLRQNMKKIQQMLEQNPFL
ncbi:hypothetical protein BJY01DRAFT_211226 [Aspergillus pseudoustus]|uniref:Zn(2)-C6 fungal-type domain-containing protein n=1 Tax=Aspergillus pseudoustus TaxID=1810923 RepID=A0ABR4KA40_9EURO